MKTKPEQNKFETSAFSEEGLRDIKYHTHRFFMETSPNIKKSEYFIVECHIKAVLHYINQLGYIIVKESNNNDR